jgi:hypothetical protein
VINEPELAHALNRTCLGRTNVVDETIIPNEEASMIRTALVESLEGRQLFAGTGLQAVPELLNARPREATVLPRFPKTSEQFDAAQPAAVYTGTATLEDGSVKRFGLAIVSETDAAVVARIQGRDGGIELTGTKTGDTYTLTTSREGRTVTVVATVDADGNLTGTITHAFTNSQGGSESHTAALSLKLGATPEKPTQPGQPRPDDNAGPETPAAPIAAFNGTVTFEDDRAKRFGVAIVSDEAGTVTARLPGRGAAHELTGTHTGNTYTLASADGNVSVTFTVDDDGNATGTLTCVVKLRDGTTETRTGALNLKSIDPTTLPVGGEDKPSTGERPVRPFQPDRRAIADAVVYTGTISGDDKSGDVFVQTYTNSEGKTMLLIAAKHRFGLRPAILEATIDGNTITAGNAIGDRSIDVELTTSDDGSLTGTITLKKADTTRVLTLDATRRTNTNA